MHRLALALAALAFALSLIALVVAQQAPPPPTTEPAAEEADELAHLMGYIQRYAEKLYFAGSSGNAPLAAFYVEELAETFGEVEQGAYVEAERELGEIVRTTFRPALDGVEAAIADQAMGPDPDAARATFDARYADLVRACNACHETTNHAFIRIVVPEQNRFSNQAFIPPAVDSPGPSR